MQQMINMIIIALSSIGLPGSVLLIISGPTTLFSEIDISGYEFTTWGYYMFTICILIISIISIYLNRDMLMSPPGPHGFTKSRLLACIDCSVLTVAATLAFRSTEASAILIAQITISMGLMIAAQTADLITLPHLLDILRQMLEENNPFIVTTPMVPGWSALLGMDYETLRLLAVSTVNSGIGQAVLDQVIEQGVSSETMHRIVSGSQPIATYSETDGIQLTWIPDLLRWLNMREEWYPHSEFLRQFRNFRRGA